MSKPTHTRSLTIHLKDQTRKDIADVTKGIEEQAASRHIPRATIEAAQADAIGRIVEKAVTQGREV